MSFNIPVKKNRTYTEFIGIRVESKTKQKINELDKMSDADVTELIRSAIKEAIDKAHAIKFENQAS